jgi:methionine-rich copper-binding protein CopC
LPTDVLPWLSRRIVVRAPFGMALLGIVLAPAAAMAHAILQQSQPPAGGSVPAGNVALSFTYNSRVDRARSRLTLTRPDNTQTVLRISQSGPPNVIGATPELTAPGPYVVRWQVLAVDGHITRGDVPFTVTGQ